VPYGTLCYQNTTNYQSKEILTENTLNLSNTNTTIPNIIN